MEKSMHRLIVVCFALLLAGCSTMGGGGTNTAASGRNIDPLNDDVANILVALDLPRGLGPAPAGQLFTFDVANGGPDQHLRISLARADDADQVGSLLPPPADGRAYYLFAVSDADKAKLQNAQAAALARNVTPQSIQIGIVPHFCTSGQVDPSTVTVSILGGVPGKTRMQPFLDNEPLSQVLLLPGSGQMPACV
jgi:predicted small secreted protein